MTINNPRLYLSSVDEVLVLQSSGAIYKLIFEYPHDWEC